jgi:putative peptidoglycan lipid II flippase
MVRNTFIVGSLTLLSRLLGFIRDLLVARLFGAGFVADAYFVAYKIPNLLRSFVAEGALTGAFVPIFAAELKQGKANASRALQEITGFLLLTTITLTIFGIYFAPEITSFFAPGFETTPARFDLSVTLLRIMFVYIVFISLVALVNGALNTVHLFGMSSISQVVMNLTLIAGALIAWWSLHQTTGSLEISTGQNLAPHETNAAVILAWSVVVGGIVQVLIQLPALRRVGLSIIPLFFARSGVITQLLKTIWPALIGASVYQIGVFLNTVLASLLQSGSVAWLFYADRLVQLPIGIFSVALASVLLPTLATAAVDKNEDHFATNLCNSLRYTNFIMIPASVGLFLFAKPLVTILFERGAFDANDTTMTALAVQGYALGLWAMSLHSMLARAFIARRDTLTPTLVGLAALTVNFLASLLLMGHPSSGQTGFFADILTYIHSSVFAPRLTFGHAGLAAASSIGAFVSLTLMWSLLKPSHTRAVCTKSLKTLLKSVVAALFMGVPVWAGLWDGSPWSAVLMGVPVCAAIYLGIGKLLKMQEIEETFSLIRRKLH